jgi:hypothetical protein
MRNFRRVMSMRATRREKVIMKERPKTFMLLVGDVSEGMWREGRKAYTNSPDFFIFCAPQSVFSPSVLVGIT